MAFGGATSTSPTTANNEEWNAVSWVEVADLSTAKKQLGGAGSSTAGLAFGGETSGADVVATTEEWSGSSTTTKTISTD